jgi:hypothetical protein
MKTTSPRFSPRLLLLAAGSAVMLAAPLSASWAGTGAKSGSPEATYRYERQKCLSGRSHQDRATCLKEAGAALAEARRGRLDSGVSERQLAENRVARCAAQPGSERADCERLARGEGTVVGSVEGGGVVKELVTRQVGTPRTN